MKQLGDKLKTLRQQAGLTQKQLGDVLHVSYQAVSKWERNMGLPDPALFPSIAEALNTTVNELFYENEDSTDPNNDFLNRKRVKTNPDAVKKFAYKPVKRNFVIILAVAIIVNIIAICFAFAFFEKKDGYKNEIAFAAQVFMQEDNISVNAEVNGKKYILMRKYFFDGRVLMYYSDGEAESYFYEGAMYSAADEGVLSSPISYEGYVALLPPFFGVEIKKDDIETVVKDGQDYKIKLKSSDNLPIAAHFGFSDDASLKIKLSEGKIKSLQIIEDERTFTIEYSFGYDFTVSLPEYIKP